MPEREKEKERGRYEGGVLGECHIFVYFFLPLTWLRGLRFLLFWLMDYQSLTILVGPLTSLMFAFALFPHSFSLFRSSICSWYLKRFTIEALFLWLFTRSLFCNHQFECFTHLSIGYFFLTSEHKSKRCFTL